MLDKVFLNLSSIFLAPEFTQETVKEAGWNLAGTICGWILIIGSITCFVMTLIYFIKWKSEGFSNGLTKRKCLGNLTGFIFCAIVGVALLAMLGVKVN